MYISDNEIINSSKKNFIGFLIGSVICIAFNFGYSAFSHGVSSNFMTYMFLIPLVLGFAVYLLLDKVFKIKNPNRISVNAYNAGLITITVYLLSKGILEIAGAYSNYPIVLLIVGITLTITGIVTFVVSTFKKSVI